MSDSPSINDAEVAAQGKEGQQTTTPVKSFLSGAAGGVSCVLVGHPFDLVKTRLQTAQKGTYTGAVDVVRRTLAADGLRGLYRGMGPPLVGVTPIFAISFWGYDLGKRLVYTATPSRPSQALTVPELAFAGFFSAVPATLVAGPAERVKVLLQVQGQGGAAAQYTGPFDVVRQLYKQGGLRSIFRGTAATLGRDGPGSAAYFVAYELVKDALKPTDSTDLSVPAIITAGASAGVAMWSIALPADTVKSKLQSAKEGTYKGVVDCVRQTFAAGGWRGFYHGFGPAMARAVPANAATFLGVEVAIKVMNSMF